eukprot:89115-Pelagomonas_calceolata.AAC.2
MLRTRFWSDSPAAESSLNKLIPGGTGEACWWGTHMENGVQADAEGDIASPSIPSNSLLRVAANHHQ